MSDEPAALNAVKLKYLLKSTAKSMCQIHILQHLNVDIGLDSVLSVGI